MLGMYGLGQWPLSRSGGDWGGGVGEWRGGLLDL
jgi:hypothetical protein